MTETLKPCPFPHDSEVQDLGVCKPLDPREGGWSIECYSCGAQGPFADTKREAIAAWNTRTPEAAEPVAFDWCKEIHEYAEGYEVRGEGGDYTPSDNERLLVEDAIHGFVSHYDLQPRNTTPPDDEAVRLLEWATSEGLHIVTRDTTSHEGEADFEYYVSNADGSTVFGLGGDTMLEALRSAYLTQHGGERHE